jgi:hypothetical protein
VEDGERKAERRRKEHTKPLVVRLVNVSVNQRMVQRAMYPIDAVVGENQETINPMSE